MATKTMKIKAISWTGGYASSGKKLDISYTYGDMKSSGILTFEIPRTIAKYRVLTFNVYPAGGSCSGCYFTGFGLDEIYQNIFDGTWKSFEINKISTERNIQYTLLKPNPTTGRKQFGWYGYTEEVCEDTFEPYIEIQYVEPEITDVTVTGNSIDSNVTVSATISDSASITIQAMLNGVQVTSATTTSTAYTFPVGTFTSPGDYVFVVTSTSSDGVQVTSNTSAALTGTQVSISDLEPNGINKLITSNIVLSFTGTNISTYTLTAKQNGVTKYTKSGTSSDGTIVDGIQQFSFTMVKNLFSSGTVQLELSCSYVGQYYTNTAISTASFLTYGPPSTPIIDSESTYSTPYPTLYFTCSDNYISYQVKIDGVQGTEIYGNPNRYKITSALANNTAHTFKVRVKNQYQLWSEWASVTFNISYAELQTPEINTYADTDNGCIVINVESATQDAFHYHSVLRSTDGVAWTEIASDLEISDSYKDETVASNTKYLYKARAYDSNGAFKDGEIVTCTCDFKQCVISIPFTDKKVILKYYADAESSTSKAITNTTSRSYQQVCGLSVPKAQRSNLKYKSFSLNLAFKTKEKYEEFMALENEEVLLFRDSKGLKAYVDMVIAKEQDMQCYYKIVSVSFTEVYYKEGDYEEAKDHTFTYDVEEF